MAIRSKNIDSGFAGWFFRKRTRITAFILACIFAGISLTGFCYTSSMRLISDMKEDYTESKEYRTNLQELYGELYVYSAAYLNQSKRQPLLEDFIYFMDYNHYQYQRTDQGVLPISSMFDFYVSFGSGGKINYVTNIDPAYRMMEEEQDEDDVLGYLTDAWKSYILRKGNEISSDVVTSGNSVDYSFPNADSGWHNYELYSTEHYSGGYVPVGGWFYDNYGRYFYNVGFDEPVILYAKLGDRTRENYAKRGGKDIYTIYYYDDYGNIIRDGTYYDSYPEFMDMDGPEPYERWVEGGFIDLEDTEDYETYTGDDSDITIFIAPNSEMLMKASDNYHRLTNNYMIANVAKIASAIFTFILLIYLIISSGAEADEEGQLRWRGIGRFEKVPVELLLIFGAASIAAITFLVVMYDETVSFFYKIKAVTGLAQVCISAAIALPMALGLLSLLQLVIDIKQHTFLKRIGLVAIVKKLWTWSRSTALYKHYHSKTMAERFSVRNRIILACVLAEPVSLILSWSIYDEWPFFLVSFFAFPPCLFCIIRNFLFGRDLRVLSRQIEAMSKDEPFEESLPQSSSAYTDHQTLLNINDSIRKSVEERIKSEKMKIELVANVSHDLKTPLTSIISYIDLLKKLELDDEASSYVQILDRKAQKLKGIVQDVFSLAKATSGIEVEMERLDFVTLFNQCLADANDKLMDCGRTIKTTINAVSAPVLGDGNKLYRVFQNLIDNSIKYSLEGTRIFYDIYKSGENVVFVTKNVSAVPIDLTPDELMERFVRGDSSRTDGGSGLGLSIAKTFTEACGGSFRIELDGDMFKTVVAMPVLKEEQETDTEKILQAVIPEEKDP